MIGSDIMLVKFLEGSDKRFIIPVYQRNYDWKTENCRQLYDDLIKISKNGKNHFFGSIVSVYHADGVNEEYWIIDGQQRLTTVSLLLLAIYNLIRQGKVTSEVKDLDQQIYKKYLIDEYKPEDTRIKLKPIKHDQSAFERLFGEENGFIGASSVTVNYRYFYERIQREALSVDELYNAIRRLQVIKIKLELERGDNPQLIFESLNSTGLALSEGDKIRNFVLMGLPAGEQQLFYEQYWNKIENCTNYQIDAFIRDYLSVKQQSTPTMSKIYFAFKHYVEENEQDVESLLKDILNYAHLYEILLQGNSDDKRLSACIQRLNRLETTVTRPFFLEVLRLKNEGILSKEDTVRIFHITETYLFRRMICDFPTNALNKIFLMLNKEIIGYDNTPAQYTEKFIYSLRGKRERARFPENGEFEIAFKTKEVYKMNGKNRAYIMERMENYGTLEDKDIYGHLDNGDYSIEHIMPQHLTPAWQKELGNNYAAIHEEWLHRIANLTLTAYNSKYSNSNFVMKRDMENGFKDSGLRMNQWIAQKNRWGRAELEERSNYLYKRALEIWDLPETDYRPNAKTFDICTLEDEADLTGRIITRFAYRGSEQPVKNWAEMFERVLRLLHSEDKSVLTQLSYKNNNISVGSTYFSRNQKDLRKSVEIEDGIYVEGNTSTETKQLILRSLFKKYGLNPSDLVFYLAEESENAAENTENRHEIRRRYWTYALPEIQKANEGAFSNVNPSKDNWINGFFGIGGFHLTCIANYGEARAELLFEKSNAAENTRAFDAIYTHQAEIEKILGEPLAWDRGNGKKSAKISHSMNGVSINKETDWPAMARFHAKWTRLLYDNIVVPYLFPMYKE